MLLHCSLDVSVAVEDSTDFPIKVESKFHPNSSLIYKKKFVFF